MSWWLIGYVVSMLLAYVLLRAEYRMSMPGFKWTVRCRAFYLGISLCGPIALISAGILFAIEMPYHIDWGKEAKW